MPSKSQCIEGISLFELVQHYVRNCLIMGPIMYLALSANTGPTKQVVFMHLFITSFGFYSPCCGSLNLAIVDCGVGEYPGLLRNVDDECGCSNAGNEVFVRTCDGDALSLSTLRTLDRVIASISCVAF